MKAELIIYVDAVKILTEKVDIEKEFRNRLEYEDEFYFNLAWDLEEDDYEKCSGILKNHDYDIFMKYIKIHIDEIYVNHEEDEYLDEETLAYSIPYDIDLEKLIKEQL